MTIRKIFLISLLIFLLQTTVMQFFRISGIVPNLNLIVIVLFIIRFDLKAVLYYSLFAGLLTDLLMSPVIGKNVLIYLILSAVLINFESIFNKNSVFSPLFLISLLTGTYHVLNYIVLSFMQTSVNLYKMVNIISIELALNIVMIIPIYLIFRRKYAL
jgi:rod shape-determining protein MreD